MHRAAGICLVMAIVPLVLGVSLFLSRSGAQATGELSPSLLAWERGFIVSAVVLTAIGLILLEGHLYDTGGRVLGRIGATTYLLAAAVLVVAEALGLRDEVNTYPLIVAYVVLAFLGQAAIGGAVLHTALLPAWIGWLTIAWNLGWLVVLPLTTPRDVYYPVLHHLMPLLIGILLLWKGAV